MIQLTANESRVLGVLVEKAHTTPQQYPLTLNALVNGCNQKSSRNPVMNLDEDDVMEAIDGLRSKQLVREAMLSGSRVAKYKHNAREALAIETPELAVLTELLLRGPQTVGELRGRASRMHELKSLEDVQEVLRGLKGREEPLVKELPPEPGSRARRYAQLLCPELNAEAERQVSMTATPPAAVTPMLSNDTEELEERIGKLEHEVQELRAMIEKFAASSEPRQFDTGID